MLRPQTFLLGALLATPALAGGPLAIRVGRAETVGKGVIENAVILVEDGKIVTIGEDLPVERGIPILDRPDWVVMPGLVSCYTRIGLDSEGGEDVSPDVKVTTEIYPGSRDLRKVVEYGVTTLGVYPAGNGIPGLAAAIRPRGDTLAELLLRDETYLKIVMRSDAPSKKRVRDAFKKADEHDEKVKKAREKWEKDKKGGAKKDEKPEEKKMAQGEGDEPSAAATQDAKADDKKSDGFVPPAPDAKSRAFVALRQGRLKALPTFASASDWLHWLDALGKEKIGFDVRLVLNQDSDLFYVFDKKTYDLEEDGIGDRKVHAIVEPLLTFTPNTRRVRNLPQELAKAGAKVCFTPRSDDLANYKAWLAHVGELVGAGLARDTALRALTLNPAEMLGVGDRVGSLEKGKDANMVFVDGDPFQPATRIQAVMLDGRFVFGEVDL